MSSAITSSASLGGLITQCVPVFGASALEPITYDLDRKFRRYLTGVWNIRRSSDEVPPPEVFWQLRLSSFAELYRRLIPVDCSWFLVYEFAAGFALRLYSPRSALGEDWLFVEPSDAYRG